MYFDFNHSYAYLLYATNKDDYCFKFQNNFDPAFVAVSFLSDNLSGDDDADASSGGVFTIKVDAVEGLDFEAASSCGAIFTKRNE